MNAANEGRKKNFLSIRPSIPKGFEFTIPGSDCFLHLARYFQKEEYSCCFCTSRGAFKTRNTLDVYALSTVLLEKRNTIVVFALNAVLLERGIQLMLMPLARYLQKQEYSCCFYTSRGAFRTRNAINVYALGAVLLERGILLLLFHFAQGFQNEEYT